MKIKIEQRDLFTVGADYHFAHCISNDFALGAGIAVEFNKRYDMSKRLRQAYPDGLYGAGCVKIDRVFNLITKEKYWHKPTHVTIRHALEKMKELCVHNGISKIAMPKIGCGLDRLKWDDVQEIITGVFADTNIEILVCYL